MTIDGFVLDIPDTPANDAEFGRAGGTKNPAPFPQVKIVGLGECGTHAVMAARGPWRVDEGVLAKELVADFEPGGNCGKQSRTGCWKSGCGYTPAKPRLCTARDGKKRRRPYGETEFTFRRFTFRPRKAVDRNRERFTPFLPAISKEAQKKIGSEVRRWRLHRQIGRTFAELARAVNPIVRGWMQYFGAFYRTAPLLPFLERINAHLMRWIRKNFKRLRNSSRPMRAGTPITRQPPRLFAHWAGGRNSPSYSTSCRVG
jgi:hypothetical protein